MNTLTSVFRRAVALSAIVGLATTAGAATTPAAAAPPPLLRASPASLIEGNTGTRQMAIPVTLSAPARTAVSVAYATADVTATAGADYTATSGRLTIPAGQTSGVINVPIVGDTRRENDEVFNLKLSSPSGATLPGPDPVSTVLGLIIINDDDYQWGDAQPIVYQQADPWAMVKVGLDDAGNATLIWNQENTPASTMDYRGIATRRYLAGKGWQPVSMIAQKNLIGGVTYQGLAVAGNGPALAAWGGLRRDTGSVNQFVGAYDLTMTTDSLTHRYDVAASVYDPAAGWSAPQIISVPTNVESNSQKAAATAMSRSGRGAVAWTAGNPTFVAYDRRTGFGAPQALTDQGGTLIDLAADDAGNVTFWWTPANVDAVRYGPGMLSRQLHADGTLGPVEAVTSGKNVAMSAVAMGRDGVAYAAWISGGALDANAGHTSLYVARRNPGEAWQAPTVVGQVPYGWLAVYWGFQSMSMNLAASASGAMLEWTTDTNPITQYSVVSPGGAWSSPANILPGGAAMQPSLALADNGEALAIFPENSPVPYDSFQLKVVRYKPGQGWSVKEHVNTPASYRGATLAMTLDGRAMVAYTGTDNPRPPNGSYVAWSVGGTRFE